MIRILGLTTKSLIEGQQRPLAKMRKNQNVSRVENKPI